MFRPVMICQGSFEKNSTRVLISSYEIFRFVKQLLTNYQENSRSSFNGTPWAFPSNYNVMYVPCLSSLAFLFLAYFMKKLFSTSVYLKAIILLVRLWHQLRCFETRQQCIRNHHLVPSFTTLLAHSSAHAFGHSVPLLSFHSRLLIHAFICLFIRWRTHLPCSP